MKEGRDLRTRAIVLRRTDFGEADRILQLLTPEGKRSVIARGVRREKSKLAGGIELFSVSDVVIHQGKGELGVLTSAKLIEYFDAFVKDLELIEQGGAMMRAVNARAEHVESEEFFDIVAQSMRAMQKYADTTDSRWKDVLRAWWGLNLVRASGEDVNLSFDTSGERLEANSRYFWDEDSMAFSKAEAGRIGADHIKMLRIMASTPAEVSLKVTGADKLIDEILYVVKCAERSTTV